MRTWIDDKDEKELQTICNSLRSLVDSEITPPHTRQHAIIFLNQIEDQLWYNVCRGSPADWDQLQTATQGK